MHSLFFHSYYLKVFDIFLNENFKKNEKINKICKISKCGINVLLKSIFFKLLVLIKLMMTDKFL